MSGEDDIDDRPRKKRKTSSEETKSQPGWPRPLGGAESAELSRLREQTFKKLWGEAEERIERVVKSGGRRGSR